MWNKISGTLVLKKHADENNIVSHTAIIQIVSPITFFFFHQVRGVEPHPSLPVLATCGRDTTIKIWEPLNHCQQPKEQRFSREIYVSLYLHHYF